MVPARVRKSPVLDHTGRNIVVMEPAYRNAGQGRAFRNMAPTNATMTTLLSSSSDSLRFKSRDLLRNNSIVWKGIKTRVAEVIGTGIQPQSQWPHADERTEIQQAWADSSKEADADGRTNFAGLQQIALREMLVAGEVFARKRRRRPEDDLVVPLQLQLLRADFCPVWMNKTNPDTGNEIRCGIERDGIGRRVAYMFHESDPGDTKGSGRFVRVPASEVIHLFECLEPGQMRGEPSLARTIRTAAMRGNYLENTALRMAVASLFAAFVTRGSDGQDPIGVDQEEQFEGEPVFEGGRINYLEHGEEITFPNTPDIGARFVEFLRALDLEQAAGMDLPVELLTGDLTHVNFSSIRAGIVTFRRQCEQLIYNWLNPILNDGYWTAWMQQGVAAQTFHLTGIETNQGARAARRVEWTPQGWPWVQPVDDVEAAKEQVKAGFRSKRSVIRELGWDPFVVEREIEEERAWAKSKSITFDTDVVTGGGASAGDPAQQQRSEARRAERRRQERSDPPRVEVVHA